MLRETIALDSYLYLPVKVRVRERASAPRKTKGAVPIYGRLGHLAMRCLSKAMVLDR
jgi:hypothetical protein